MPNRIIKESICSSESIDTLSWFEEVMFYRLIVTCDDNGRTDARPKILKANLFPLKDVRPAQIESALKVLSSAELVDLYEVDGKPFLQMRTWEKHQRVRNVRSKYPGPDGSFGGDPPQSAASCGELPQTAANGGDPPLARAQNPNPNPNPNPNTKENPKRASTIQDDGFEKFWDAYPKKSGDIRQAYQEYVVALGSATPEELLKAIQDQTAATEEDELKYFPSADKWLRNRSWRTRPKSATKKPPRTFTPTQFE